MTSVRRARVRRRRAPANATVLFSRLCRCLRTGALAGALLGANAFAADPQIAQWTDNPDPVPAGGLVTYSARIDNSSLDDASNVVVSVPVPAGATFVSATAPCALATGTVTCSLGTVGGNSADPRLLDFVFRANGPGPASITAVATLTASNDTNTTNNAQSQTTTVISGGNLALTKTGSPNPVIGGANVTYTLTASNAGPNASGDIVVTDNLPPSTSFVSSAGTGWSCSIAGQVVTCAHAGPHAVNAPIPPLSLVAKVNAAGGTITNSATVAPAAGGTPDPDTSNNTATVNTTVTPGADLRIAQKSVTSATPAIAGQNVTFQIQPRNDGPAPAVNAVVTDNLPAGWTFVSATGPNWSCSASGLVVACSRASFPVGGTDEITVVARAPLNAAVGPSGTTYTNNASIASATPDPDSSNNAGSVGVLVLPDGADLRISKSKTPNPVALGSTLTSTIAVANNGPRVATGPLRVIEVLSGETYASASGSGWTCVPNGTTIVCTNTNSGGLAVGSALPDLVILTTATTAGSAINNACTGSSVPAGAVGAPTASPPVEGDPNTGNDCVSVSSTSTSTRPDLAITKATSTPTGGDKIVSTSEGSVTYTLVARNATTPGIDAATGVVIADTVPAYVTGGTTIDPVTAIVSAGTATFGCTISGATVTCTQSGGQLLPGQTVTVPIKVNRPMIDGTFTNTATVGNTAEGDPNASNNSASDTVQIAPIADIEVTGKTIAPTSVRAGEQATYVISYRNNGPSQALNVNLTDVFTFAAGDTGATVVSIASSKPGSTCSIAAGAILAPATNSYSCALGTLANGETQSITLVVRPNYQPGNAARVFANTASITTTTVENPAGGNNGNNSKSASLPINPAVVDLLVNKLDFEDPVPFSTNAFLNYRVSVTNNGPSYATAVRVAESMSPPPGRRIRFVCDTTGPSSATCNAPSLCTATNVTSSPGVAIPTFSCAVPAGTSTTGLAQGELAVNQVKSVFLRFEALDQPMSAGDTFSNVATVSANEPDSFPGNDTATEQTTVRQRIDLAVAKTSSLSTVSVHQPFTWTVTVTNNGTGNSLQTDLTDTLPAGVTVTGPVTFSKTNPGTGGTCTNAAGVLSCALGVLNNGGVATILIPARIDAYPTGGTSINSATVDTDPTKIGGIDPVPGNDTGSSTVTVARSSVSGTVFEDRDRAGANGGTPQSPATEPRIAGVTVTLSGTDLYGFPISVTTTTDASGNYTFDNLGPSSAPGYVITETQPAGYANSPSNPPTNGPLAPSDGGTYASGGRSGNSTFTGVIVGANSTSTNYNFPEVRSPSLSGFVYIDVNQNNVRDAGTDLPIANATVILRNASTGAIVATTTTDATGAYLFANLDASTVYTLEEPLPTSPAGLVNGPVNPGLVAGAACATGCTAQPNTPIAGTDRIATIDLSSGADGTQFNFGERTVTTIAGTVYIDRNRNGTLDATPTDGRIAGVTVRLVQGASCAAGTTLQTTTTAADGTYFFSGATAGQNYLLCETQPTGYAQGSTNPGGSATTPVVDTIAINNLPITGSIGNNFGERASSIAGNVFLDANNDGLRTGDAGIAGVTITLTGTDAAGNAVNRTTTSDATGAWRFDDLLAAGAGGYAVTEQSAQPVVAGRATLNGRTTAGTVGGTTTGIATGVAVVPSAISTIALPAGADGIEYDFGETPPVSVSGTVYADNNNNGSIDAGEPGLAGVTIVLTGSDDQGPVSITVVTDTNGVYTFPTLRPGTYTVTEPTQPTGTLNGITTPGTVGGVPTGVATPTTVTPSAIGTIVLAPGAQSIGNNFGEIGSSPDLFVTKAAVEPRFTVNNVGTYTIRVRNGGAMATSGAYRVGDRLPTGLALDSTPTGTGWTCSGAQGATTFACTSSDVLAPGAIAANAITAKVRIGSAALANSPVDNAVLVEGGGESDARGPTQAERDAFNGNAAALPVCVSGITQNACRVPTPIQASASISGTVWYDIGTAMDLLDGGDRRLSGWQVEVLDANGNIVARATTGADGAYRVNDLVPGVPLTVRFRDPQSGIVWGYPINGEVAPGSSGTPCNQAAAIAAGTSSSCVGTGATPALTVVLAAGQNLPQQSLPVDPSGVVYDANLRQPVPGSVVTLAPVGTCNGWDPSTSLVATGLGGYTINGAAVSMTVDANGLFQFLFAPAAPASCTFGLTVAPPNGYRFASTIIPPATGPLVPSGGRGATFPVQPQAAPPTSAVGPGTVYYLTFVGGSGGPNLIHDNIPLDPSAPVGLSLSKTGDKQVVELGDTIRYTITVVRNGGPVPPQVSVVDRLPEGFTFINGTAIVNGSPIADPVGKPGPRLTFNLGAMGASGQLVLQYRARVGVGSQQGDGVNRAIGYACGVASGCVTSGTDAPIASATPTNPAQYRVRITGGAFTTEACFAGKIFVDCNGNHVQDPEELGIPGVRLVLSDGTTLISDSEGKYSLCGMPPRSAVLKVDPHTLPTGSHLTTSSNRNLGDAGSLWLDLKNGELYRADFVEGSCSNTVLDQVKARRAQGEVRSVETEGRRAPALRFESKAHGLDRTTSPKEGTDTANQPVPKVRDTSSDAGGLNAPR